MNNLVIVTPEKKAENRIEFDRVSHKLSGVNNILSKIKTEIASTKGKFNSMVEILTFYPDQISLLEKQLYDVQCQAFIHTLFMYVNILDSDGTPFINPVSENSTSTDISMTINFPHYTITKNVAHVENISIDISEWDMYIGTNVINALKSEELTEQFSVVAEVPTQYFSRSEFITGITFEIEKLLVFQSSICQAEQSVNSALKYISELKTMGLY